ncbi:Uma2 family endonuclease [Nocardia harenae]|uniref:Uma2 family endonuclease n=1 Tax=Nocardia harenae TaxID=358707 RepID=UPI0008342537|nr:Uma2 family endonuclease [Nocardia harenae]
MALAPVDRPDLPEFMTWEELERLPEEIAARIELWEGRVVWLRRGPAEHQEFTNLMWSGLRRCAREYMDREPEQCWRVHTETNIFFGPTGKSDFVTPDFLIHECLPEPYQDVRAHQVLLVGEVLSPANSHSDREGKKARYARAGIPWYWEVALKPHESAIATVDAHVLETGHGRLPTGVHPLYPANYVPAGRWIPADSDAVSTDFPFPIRIPWTDLQF